MEPMKSEYGRSYEQLITSAGVTILDIITLGQWQGDHLMIVQEDDKYGLLVVGYGSCSGCDALEAACDEDDRGDHNWSALEALRLNLYQSINWKTAGELAVYLRDKDLEAEYYYHLDDDDTQLKRFIDDNVENLLIIDLAQL